MIQRKCGTCRYFEEGGIAASGWCKHPERQDIQHMVLVRKTELACRDGWDHDLWEPDESFGPESRATASAMASSGSKDPGRSSSNGTPRQSPRAVNQDPEDRHGLEGSFGTWPDTSQGNAQESSQRYSSNEPERSEPTVGAWPSKLDPVESEMDTQFDEVRDETFSVRGLRPDADWRQQLTEMRQAAPRTEGSFPKPPVFERDDELYPEDFSDPSIDRDAPDAAPTFGVTDWGNRGDFGNEQFPADAREGLPVQQSGLTEPFEFTPGEGEEGYDIPEPLNGVTHHYPEGELDRPPLDTPYEDYGELEGDGQSTLPASLADSQCCRTCRDFIPSDDGKSGWCNNAFAFPTRQQVDREDLACQGTFGNWWSPSDDWWIERADISHHSTPTPLVEELIREIHDQHETRQGSTSRPRRP